MITKVELKDFRCPAEIDVRTFMETDWEAAEVDYSNYKSIRTAATAYANAAKKIGADIRVAERNGKLYIIKK